MWLARQCLTTSAARLGALCVEMTLGCQPAQLSMLQFLDYVRMNGGIQFLTEVEAGAQQWWVGNGGAGRVASLLLDKIKETHPTNFTAKLGCAAAAIRCTGAAAGAACPTTPLRVEAAGGAAFVARQVILAVPPTAALEHLTFEPPPPVAWAHAAQRSFMGCYTKCVVVYDDALRVAAHERSLRRVRPRHRRRRLERKVLECRRRRDREYHLAGDEGGATRGFDAEGRGGARGAGGGAGAADGGGGAAELRGEVGRVRLLYLVEEEGGDAAGAAVAHPPLLGAGLNFCEELDAAVHADVVEELEHRQLRRLAAEGHLDAEGAEARRRRREALAREPHFHSDAVERVEGVALLLGRLSNLAVDLSL